MPRHLARSAIWFPLVGAVVGGFGALTLIATTRIWPPLVAAVLALIATVLLTGAFHEDALADAADGFGGGVTRDGVLEIMRDSRIGAYGAVALFLVLAARIACLAAMAPLDGARALIGAHVLARWSSLPLIWGLPYARMQGAGKPFVGSVTGVRLLVGTLFAAAIIVPTLGLQAVPVVLIAAVITAIAAWYFHTRLGGISGDCLGATNQLVELLYVPDNASMRLLLVRHGIAEGQEGRVVGHANPPLSDRGRTAIAALLASSPAPPDLLLSSDLRRARSSADILAAYWGIEVVADARLRELNFGEWENRTWSELEALDGARLDHWMRDWTREAPPGGESFGDLGARTSAWLADRRKSGWDALGTMVVVAHAGSIRAILCELLSVPLDQAFAFDVDHAHVRGLDLGAAPSIVLYRNRSALTPGASPGSPEYSR